MKKIIHTAIARRVSPRQGGISATLRLVRPFLTIGFSLLLALFSAALTYSAPPAMQGHLAAAASFLQPTATPKPQGLSQIGSTDGIVVMGFVIVLIIVIPILLQRKSWMENR